VGAGSDASADSEVEDSAGLEASVVASSGVVGVASADSAVSSGCLACVAGSSGAVSVEVSDVTSTGMDDLPAFAGDEAAPFFAGEAVFLGGAEASVSGVMTTRFDRCGGGAATGCSAGVSSGVAGAVLSVSIKGRLATTSLGGVAALGRFGGFVTSAIFGFGFAASSSIYPYSTEL